MNDNKSEKDYFNLLQSGMFWEIYPELTGEWEQDKDEFIKSEQYLNENFRNKKMNVPIYLMQQQLYRYMDSLKHRSEPLAFEPLQEIKIEPKANLQPSTPIERNKKVTPILALYLNIDGIDDVQEAFDFAQKSMKKYENHGWTYIIIPITDGRDSFIESHSVERLDPIELKQLETKILETIKTGE